ncbi:MAG TPA: alpha/beta hydrolase [Steroidobacteraceae bacterium]|nr:alpha/beta hydrolase [Steroidobacteraceae bacterium]
MAHSVVSWATLLLGVIGALFAVCALVPVAGQTTSKLSAWHLVFGLPGSELSTLLATIGVVLAAAGWALGAGTSWPGRMGLTLDAVAVLGLLWALWRARWAGEVIESAFRAAWGAQYRDEIAPSRRALLQRKLSPAQWWKPIAYRHPEVEWRRHLPYVANAHPQQYLDVMVPRAPSAGPRPVLLNIHGGGWMIGRKGTQAMPLLMHMASHGWLAVDADYRLSPSARMPDHIVDVKLAIAWTREHAAEFGGDPHFIVITGGSAGGHLVALAALTANQPELQPGFESADTSVQVVVPFYGKYDMLGEYRPDAAFAEFMTRNLMPGPRHTHEALWRAMHPTSHLGSVDPERAPPFLVLHGTHDQLIPLNEARWFVGELRKHYPGEVVYVELPYAHHAWDLAHSLRADLTVEALQRYLELQYARWCRRNGVEPTAAAGR